MTTSTVTVIDYSPGILIRNVDSLGRGSGCKFLICIETHLPGQYVAKQWKRKMPMSVKRGEVVFRF